jgi:flagellar biosynthetic protein FliR
MTPVEAIADQTVAALLVSLRIAPVLAFAPPFTLLRVPASVRVILSLGLALWMVVANPEHARSVADDALLAAVLGELLLGMSLALSLQLAFSALLVVGRAIDIQVGFGLAQVADPTLRSQMPLVGTLFSYAAAAVFFLTTGPADFLAIWSQSLAAVPVGSALHAPDPRLIAGYLSAVFVIAVGIGALVLLVLFLVDVSIALMSRTLPQMNMLVFGFQVKTIALLATLPFVFAFSSSLFLRLVRLAIDTAPRLI